MHVLHMPGQATEISLSHALQLQGCSPVTAPPPQSWAVGFRRCWTASTEMECPQVCCGASCPPVSSVVCSILMQKSLCSWPERLRVIYVSWPCERVDSFGSGLNVVSFAWTINESRNEWCWCRGSSAAPPHPASQPELHCGAVRAHCREGATHTLLGNKLASAAGACKTNLQWFELFPQDIEHDSGFI